MEGGHIGNCDARRLVRHESVDGRGTSAVSQVKTRKFEVAGKMLKEG